MATTPTTGFEEFCKLCNKLGLKRVRRMSVHFDVESVVTIHVECLPDSEQVEAIIAAVEATPNPDIIVKRVQ